jgi:hypothetical protein
MGAAQNPQSPLARGILSYRRLNNHYETVSIQ